MSTDILIGEPTRISFHLVAVNRVLYIYRTEHCFGLPFSPEWNSPFKERRRRKCSNSRAYIVNLENYKPRWVGRGYTQKALLSGARFRHVALTTRLLLQQQTC